MAPVLVDQDGLVAARPELVGPASQARELAGQVSVEVPHELGELLSILNPEEHVVVRGEEGESHDLHRVAVLGASENAEEDVVALLRRAQQKAPLDSAAGDLDEGPAFGHETEMSAHAQYQSENGGRILHSTSKIVVL